ncbi:MAG: cytochrome o ubiquinol oxidase subunit IV [Candidatus Saccharimonadales bacterium]
MSKQEHGTIASYVIGFITCLVLTTIPYYLVVNHKLSADRLLIAIVAFAALQMAVQIFFFLHLGRGPKPLYNVIFFAATVGLVTVVVGGSLFIMSNLHYNMSPTETAKQLAEGEAVYQVEGNKTGACQGTKDNHQIIIKADLASPVRVDAQLCDTLSFTNQDSLPREISFGTPSNPTNYAGESSLTIRKGKSETITLNQAGSYSYYDHQYPNLVGGFTVTVR